MNERIKELKDQCWVEKHWDNGMWIEKHIDQEKFALLIVKECIEQASIGNGHGNNQWDRALTFSAKNIKEHFGVESA